VCLTSEAELAKPDAGARWPGRVMFVSPHARFFVGDQFRAVSDRVGHASVLIPSPFFSTLARSLPFSSGRFASLRLARESAQRIPKGDLLRARYFDLPGESTRRLTDSLAAASSCRAVIGSGVSFDLIHSHFLGLYGFIGMRLKERFGKPLVLTAYGGDAYSVPFRSPFANSLARSVVRAADGLIAVSKPIAENLCELGADQKKVHVIPTGFDASLFSPSDQGRARQQLGLPAGKTVLLTVANFVPQKGHTYLLDALKAGLSSRDDLILVLVGGGRLETGLRDDVSKLGLTGKVVFAGPRPHEEIPTWLNASDLFVLPSVSEGSPTVLPEAMACAKPVVATRVGGIPDVVGEGTQGLLVPPRDPSALAEAILSSLGRRWNPEQIRSWALGYSWGALASRIAGVYSELVPFPDVALSSGP